MNWPDGRRCWVLVLGDFGRSPRMQYHTDSLLRNGLHVTVIAFPDSAPLAVLVQHPNCRFAAVSQVPNWLSCLPTLLLYLLKPVFQFMQLLIMMFFILPSPEFVLVQIPPAIPTLFICGIVRMVHGARVYLDWHNFGFSLSKLNPRFPRYFLPLAESVEKNFGRFADGHFCVSQAMRAQLREWGITAKVVYDRPHERYRQATVRDTHQLMHTIRDALATPMHENDFCAQNCRRMPEEESILTRRLDDYTYNWKANRPAVLVSSTSWTPDEDFSILLTALEDYDQRHRQMQKCHSDHRPKLLVFITGRGPLQEHYIEELRKKDLRFVAVRTLWLAAEDYPVLLGSADLGISLHTSSSGVDLPMKIVDMFGCALPVCTPNYPAISELVEDNVNGCLFRSAQDLYLLISDLLTNFHSPDQTQLTRMRQHLLEHRLPQWHENWMETVWETVNDA